MAFANTQMPCCRHPCHRRRCHTRILRRLSLCRYFAIGLLLLLLTSFAVLLYYSTLLVQLNYCCSDLSDVIVSLTTTPARFHYELPIAVHSLLTQSVLPREIRIYLSPAASVAKQKNVTVDHLRTSLTHIDGSGAIKALFDKLVQIRWEEEDYGPATKFLPIIKEFHSASASLSKTQAIIVCDDDHYYHPQMIATLVTHSNRNPRSLIGLRGWRSTSSAKYSLGT